MNSRTKKTLATIAFIVIIYALDEWLGFERMVMVVMAAWFTTIIDK